jgi:hypothetical protein
MWMSGVALVMLKPLAHADHIVLYVANRSIELDRTGVAVANLQIFLWAT